VSRYFFVDCLQILTLTLFSFTLFRTETFSYKAEVDFDGEGDIPLLFPTVQLTLKSV
jgi:hypothetical protein